MATGQLLLQPDALFQAMLGMVFLFALATVAVVVTASLIMNRRNQT